MIVNKHAWRKGQKMSNLANFEDWRENEPWSDDGDDYDDDDVGYEEDDAGNVVRVGQERKNKQSSDDHSRVDLMAKYRCVLDKAVHDTEFFGQHRHQDSLDGSSTHPKCR